MKTLFIYFLISTTIFTLNAQDYQINFTGSGAATNVDSVKVENLTQCTFINMSGSDILHLVASLDIDDNIPKSLQMVIFPNPSTGDIIADLDGTINGELKIEIYDLHGKTILQVTEFLNKGHQRYLIRGLSSGLYTLKAESKTFHYNTKIVSINQSFSKPEIAHFESFNNDLLHNNISNFNDLKSTNIEKSVVDMQYTAGDLLKLTGKTDNYRTVVMLVPDNSQTVSFNFIPCTDNNGNSYAVVEIGAQWWMAENLNSGTYATITTPQVWGTKFCMDINGQADPNCPMGGLYEFANLMQGATQCNGTGAPPNDRCVVPVKGLCPDGWHVPSHYEWTTLERNAGSSPNTFPYDISTISLLGSDEGGNLKETCTNYWWSPNAGATNKTGFSGLPGGDTWNGVFEDFGQSAYFWTSTEPLYFAWVHALNYSLSVVGRSSYAVESGFSVRCVKD